MALSFMCVSLPVGSNSRVVGSSDGKTRGAPQVSVQVCAEQSVWMTLLKISAPPMLLTLKNASNCWIFTINEMFPIFFFKVSSSDVCVRQVFIG